MGRNLSSFRLGSIGSRLSERTVQITADRVWRLLSAYVVALAVIQIATIGLSVSRLRFTCLAAAVGPRSACTHALLWLATCTLPDRSCDGNAYHIPATGFRLLSLPWGRSS